MALIKCAECGREISDKAEMCPGCGYPIKRNGVLKSDSYKNRIRFNGISILALSFGLILLFFVRLSFSKIGNIAFGFVSALYVSRRSSM